MATQAILHVHIERCQEVYETLTFLDAVQTGATMPVILENGRHAPMLANGARH